MAMTRGSSHERRDELWPYAEAFCGRAGHEWELIDKIGSGNFASVYQLEADGRAAALKIYRPRFFEGDSATVERRRVVDQMRLKGHGHPNIVDFFEAGEINDTYFLLMEFFPWQSMEQRLSL